MTLAEHLAYVDASLARTYEHLARSQALHGIVQPPRRDHLRLVPSLPPEGEEPED